MRSSTVAFRGRKQVVDAYVSNEMVGWAICSGKEMMFADDKSTTMEEGESLLRETLERLQTGGSRAIFTLRTYEDYTKILSNTPYSRSFNFGLYDEDDDMRPFDRGRQLARSEYEERIDILEQEIKLLKLEREQDMQDDEEEKGGIGAVVGQLIELPGVKQALANKLIGLVSAVIPLTPPQPAAVGGVPAQAKPSVLQPGQPEKVQHAVSVLCGCDPLLGDHLLKIAAIATDNPVQYAWLCGMLK